MRVFVYFNLHRQCWSIKALDGEKRGRVIGHASAVYLRDVEFRVSEAGRQRVLREQRKNVHAGVVGVLERWQSECGWKGHGCWPEDTTYAYQTDGIVTHHLRATYNPYKGPSFVDADTLIPIKRATAARLTSERRVFYTAPTDLFTEVWKDDP